MIPFTKEQYNTLKHNIGCNVMYNNTSNIDDNIAEHLTRVDRTIYNKDDKEPPL